MSSGGKTRKKSPITCLSTKKILKNQNNPEWNEAQYQYTGRERGRNEFLLLPKNFIKEVKLRVSHIQHSCSFEKL